MRGMYRAQNAPTLWLGLAGVLAFVAFLFDPATAESGQAGKLLAGPLEFVYHSFLGVGGALVAWGVWKVRPRAEIIGHTMFAIAVAITSLGILVSLGTIPAGLTLLGVAVANVSRAYFLWTTATGER